MYTWNFYLFIGNYLRSRFKLFLNYFELFSVIFNLILITNKIKLPLSFILLFWASIWTQFCQTLELKYWILAPDKISFEILDLGFLVLLPKIHVMGSLFLVQIRVVHPKSHMRQMKKGLCLGFHVSISRFCWEKCILGQTIKMIFLKKLL